MAAELEDLARFLDHVRGKHPRAEGDEARVESPTLTEADDLLLDEAWRAEAQARGVESSA